MDILDIIAIIIAAIVVAAAILAVVFWYPTTAFVIHDIPDTPEPHYKCPKCKDTGIYKFKDIELSTMYHWLPWQEAQCDCQTNYGEELFKSEFSPDSRPIYPPRPIIKYKKK